jgi:hypothetical protein
MGEKIRQHIGSNVVGYVALFFALSGGAAWATHPGGANTISSTDIIDNEVKTQDVRDGNIRREDIRTDAVVTEHIADGAVQSADLADRERLLEIPAASMKEEDATLQTNFFTGYPAMRFSQTTDQSALAVVEVPVDRAAGTDLDIRYLWSGSGAAAASGDVIWELRFKSRSIGEFLSGGLGTDSATGTVVNNGELISTSLQIPPSEIQNGELLLLTFRRNADDSGDTFSDNAYLALVEVRYTAVQ